MLSTLTALPSVGSIAAFVSQNPKNPRGHVTLYGELLFTCRIFMSEFVSVILKNLRIGLNSRQTCIFFVYFDQYYNDVLDL